MGETRLDRRLFALGVALLTPACEGQPPPLILAATTSTYDSGILDTLVAAFGREHPEVRIRTVVAGSGQALELGRRGDADVLLVHAPEAEERFVREGHATDRRSVMENDFLIVGPPGDPAGIGALRDPAAALGRIAEAEATFLSRGDSSGTHERELALWEEAGVRPAPPWYLESGQGQGTTLQVASERRAYTLTDRATFHVLAGVLDLDAHVQGHPALVNRYSAILPASSAHPRAAALLIGWITSEAGRRTISGFRRDRAGVPLFSPVGPEDATNPGPLGVADSGPLGVADSGPLGVADSGPLGVADSGPRGGDRAGARGGDRAGARRDASRDPRRGYANGARRGRRPRPRRRPRRRPARGAGALVAGSGRTPCSSPWTPFSKPSA